MKSFILNLWDRLRQLIYDISWAIINDSYLANKDDYEDIENISDL